MQNIEISSKIKRETLSEEHYFKSLLENAYIAQLLFEPELEKIQLECLELLAKKTEQFNGGDSSSIKIENAQSILSSIMFTVGVALKQYLSPDDAVAAVQSIGVKAIYEDGRKRIARLVLQAKSCHSSLVRNLIETKNVFYSSTAVDGIKGFFKLYDAEFAAQEIHITADYPAYNKAPRLLGIEFILQYLKQLCNENLFCANFSNKDIHYLLCGYDEQYENLLFNIYEPVLAASLGCIIADASANSLDITPELQSIIFYKLKGKEQAEIEKIFSNALLKLAEKFSFSDSLLLYVQHSLPQLAAAVCAIKAKSLERVFIAAKYPENSPKLFIAYGTKMDDEQYRNILKTFNSSDTSLQKTNIIKTQINSLADLEDLLLDAELSAEEIMIILKSLESYQITALIKKLRFINSVSFTDLRDCEKKLYKALNEFTAALPLKQQELMEKAVNALKLEGID